MGNALERGAGSGPYYDRFAHVCGFEVVLPTGELVNTGLGRFPGAKTASLHRWGVGPYTDGIFAQSNLGVVIRMTVWLAPIPEYFQSCFFGIDDDSRLEDLIDALQLLQLQGLCRAGVTVRNDFNVLSRMQQYPWEAVVHGLLRDKFGSRFLVDDLGGLPLEHTRLGHERRRHLQLGLELHRRAYIPRTVGGAWGAGAFWLFAAIGIVAWLFVFFMVPETKGRSLEEIEADLRGTVVPVSRVR